MKISIVTGGVMFIKPMLVGHSFGVAAASVYLRLNVFDSFSIENFQ